MDLYEYQGKQYFARFGIPTSPGGVADTVDEAVEQAEDGRLSGRRQGPGEGGRPRQGRRHQAGRRPRRGPPAPPRRSSAWTSRATWSSGVWVEHASDIAKEYYASFTLDRPAKLHLGMLSAEGGVEIEEVAATNPEAIARLHINPCDGLDEETARRWVDEAGLDEEARDDAARLLVRLYHCFVEGDCDLAEINPLILTTEGRVHALDAKVTLDENAAFRHPEWEELAGTDTDDPREKMAKEKGLNYIGLDGHRRHHRQRGRAGHEHPRRREPGRRDGSQLPRHRRRGQRRGHDRGARGDQRRPQREVDPRQHLRRDHPGRRRRQRRDRRRWPTSRSARRSCCAWTAPTPRRVGPASSHTSPIGSWPNRRCSPRPAGPSSWPDRRGSGREHLRRRDDQGHRAGLDRWPGPLSRAAQPRLWHQGDGRRHPRQGRHRRGGHPGL